MKLKKYTFLFLNIFVPLILGFGIYVFMKKGTYINTFLKTDFDYYPKSFLGEFIVNWFCDFLWAYALAFALYFALSPFCYKVLISSVLTLFLGITLEFLQKSDVLSGIFDWWDIVAEIASIIISATLLFCFENKKLKVTKNKL